MNELINVRVETIDGVLVTTSNRVAEELEVRHDNLIIKIDGYLSKFSSPEISGQFYIPSEYKTLDGRTVRNYLITEKGIAQLIGGYSAAVPKAFDLNVAYINEFERMKNELSIHRVPRTMKEALLIALEQQEKIETLQLENQVKDQQIAELRPKATYYDLILQCADLISMTEIAKDYGMSAKAMNKTLHELGIQYKQSGQWLLYRQYQDRGYTHSETVDIERSDGRRDITMNTKWTQKGRLALYELLKRNGILPMIERKTA